MKGFTAIIVGYQGAGKSLLAKSLARKVHEENLRILDTNNEYKEEFPNSVVNKIENGKQKPDFDTFEFEMVENEETVFIIEDATIVFSHRGYNPELVRAIIGKRHSKNVYILLFHSLRVVPRDVFEYADELWLLKTSDTDDVINAKYKGTGVQELLNAVRELPEFEYNEKQKIPVRDKHYKVLQIKKGKLDKTVTRASNES